MRPCRSLPSPLAVFSSSLTSSSRLPSCAMYLALPAGVPVCCVVSLADGGREVGCGKNGWSETACKQGKEASNVLYIPSTPMCQQNAKYIAQQRKAFVKVLLCSALACEPDQKLAARRVWPREMLRCVCCLRKRRPDRACLWWGMSAFRHSGISAFHSG